MASYIEKFLNFNHPWFSDEELKEIPYLEMENEYDDDWHLTYSYIIWWNTWTYEAITLKMIEKLKTKNIKKDIFDDWEYWFLLSYIYDTNEKNEFIKFKDTIINELKQSYWYNNEKEYQDIYNKIAEIIELRKHYFAIK